MNLELVDKFKCKQGHKLVDMFKCQKGQMFFWTTNQNNCMLIIVTGVTKEAVSFRTINYDNVITDCTDRNGLFSLVPVESYVT